MVFITETAGVCRAVQSGSLCILLLYGKYCEQILSTEPHHTQTVSPTTKRDLKDRASRGVTKYNLRLQRTLTMTLTWRRNLTIIVIKFSWYFITYVSTTQTTGNSQHKISAWWRNDLACVWVVRNYTSTFLLYIYHPTAWPNHVN